MRQRSQSLVSFALLLLAGLSSCSASIRTAGSTSGLERSWQLAVSADAPPSTVRSLICALLPAHLGSVDACGCFAELDTRRLAEPHFAAVILWSPRVSVRGDGRCQSGFGGRLGWQLLGRGVVALCMHTSCAGGRLGRNSDFANGRA